MKKSNKKKTGFAEGRSKTRPSVSSAEKDLKREKKFNKLNKAKDELADVLKGTGLVGSDGLDAEMSRFQKEMGSVRKLISNKNEDDLNTEVLNKMMLRSMLAMTLDVIPLAEKAFRGTMKENAAYALIALIKEAKEISTELNMIGNVENQSAFIKDSIITPLFNAMAQHFLQEMLSMKSTIDTELAGKPKTGKRLKRQLDEIMKSIGMFMTQSNDKIAESVHLYLSGQMADILSPSTKKRKKKV